MPRLVCLVLVFCMLGVLGLFSLEIAGPSAVYPRVLIACALVLLAMTAFIELRRRDEGADAELQLLASGPTSARARFAAFAGAWVMYPILLPLFGFIATTALVLTVSTKLLGWRGLPGLVLGSLLFALAFAVALKTVIYVPVPSAWPDHLLDGMAYALRRA